MAEAKEFMTPLQYFAEGFTGTPVRILTSSSDAKRTQAESSVDLYVPHSVEVRDDERADEIAFNTYRGIVALQASAALYRGIPKREDVVSLGERLGIPKDVVNRFGTLDQVLTFADENRNLKGTYQTIEIARRMQALGEDYPILHEDMVEGFSKIFTPRSMTEGLGSKRDTQITTLGGLVDLSLAVTYWRNLGVDEEMLTRIASNVPVEEVSNLEKYRDEIVSILSDLSRFSDPRDTSYEDTLKRFDEFRGYIGGLVKDTGHSSPFRRVSPSMSQEEIGRTMSSVATSVRPRGTLEDLKERKEVYEKALKDIKEGRKPTELPKGLSDKESIQRRLEDLEKRSSSLSGGSRHELMGQNIEGSKDTKRYALAGSLLETFGSASDVQITDLEIPEVVEKDESGRIVFVPEVREGGLMPRATRIRVYDLTRETPPNKDQISRRREIESEIEKAEETITSYRRIVEQHLWDAYHDMDKRRKESDRAHSKVKRLRRDLERLENLYDGSDSRELEVDPTMVAKVRREMEAIKPEARTIVRGCLEGELDSKAYFDYLLAEEAAEEPVPAFYFQWKNRQRDVSSVLLLDASASSDKLLEGSRTILDAMKEAAYYYALGAETLEDRIAVVAYNGRGHDSVRAFLLKGFDEGLNPLKERLERLKPELNNRDGAAIRYATQLLADEPSKTKFLFHIGDMQPSDVILEEGSSGIITHPYRGRVALEDVVHAHNSARNQGITPVGVLLGSKTHVKRKAPVKREGRRIDPSVLEKLKRRRKAVKKEVEDTDERVKRGFERNLVTVSDIEKLPQALRNIYVGMTFS